MEDSWRGGYSQPGARSSRQENRETEVKMPVEQAGVRSASDIIAVLLILGALAVLGRWGIWLAIVLVLYSEYYQIGVDRIVGRLYDPAATAVDWASLILKWLWPFLGYPFLRIFFPITWTSAEMLWQRAVLEFAWPFVHSLAIPWSLPVSPGIRLIVLVVLIAPLFTWRILRDRMQWALWEFTPYGPVDVATQGVDPHKWGPPAETPTTHHNKGVIVEKTDYEPHVERVAEGVYISNGSGRSAVRIDMRWVSDEQWAAVTRLLLEQDASFSEETLGRGIVFSTHGPFDEVYRANLGFRFFRDQMIECGYAQYRGGHPNAGVELTPLGIDFLRRNFGEEAHNDSAN